LRAALETGQVAAAGFDVFVNEPAKDSVLFGAPNFVATPHVGASTNEAQETVAIQIAEQMSDYLLAGAVTNAINMASISAEEAPRIKPFIGLIDKLGSFAEQIADEEIEALEIELINNLDRPGLVGALGTMLGEASINIATFQGRQAAVQDATAIVGVDQIVPEAIQQRLRALPHVRYVKVLKF
jgi:D-3-phosphoglycerate dehydrogenase